MSQDLEKIIKDWIKREGYISIADYMQLALTHPTLGYYCRGISVGKDFITSPEISQMFGEMLAVWIYCIWQQMPHKKIALIELGPGKGTLMADILRVVQKWPGFLSSLEIHLVETSPILKKLQNEALDHPTILWHQSIETLPEMPSIILANEFFDALPIRQLLKTDSGWCERIIQLDDQDNFIFNTQISVSPYSVLVPDSLQNADNGSLFECSPVSLSYMEFLSKQIATHNGAMLVIDYGHNQSICAETFQAIRDHKPQNVLSHPGLNDLTAHVDFMALSRTSHGSHFGPIPQGTFLNKMGLHERATTLAKNKQTDEIWSAYSRLTDETEMGSLFKVLAIAHPSIKELPGF